MSSITEEIKSRLDLVEVISETVQLRKSGASYVGFCPFHQNTRTPAFVVFPGSQTWRCFGACAEGGDLFSYVMKREGWEFREALRYLADRAGVRLEEFSLEDKAHQDVQSRLTTLLAAGADYFHYLLLHAPEAETARRYVAGRQLQEETVATFKVGFALDSWDACRTHFNSQGYSDDELVAVGLLTENRERQTRYDRFRNRLMIPIRDADGQVVGFGARTLEPDGLPKYLNSPQTELFDKGRLLFGFDLARRHIREARQAVIVEGYMDVLQGWQHGFRNLVAQMGTALTGAQLQLLKRNAKTIVIALDADAAGLQATMRSLNVARDTFDREPDVRFDAAHLVRHEGRLRADIRVVSLPAGNDPDKLIREQPTLWPQLVAAAQPVVSYVIDVLTADVAKDDAKAKAEVVRNVMPLISDVADPVERDHYRQQLARRLRVDERALQQVALEVTPGKRKQPVEPAASIGLPTKGSAENGAPVNIALRGGRISLSKREASYLGQCLNFFPELPEEVDRSLAQLDQEPVTERDFANPEYRALWRQLRHWMTTEPFATIDDLWDILDSTLRRQAQSLYQTERVEPAHREKLPDLLAYSILDIRLEQTRRQLSEIQQLSQEGQQSGDAAVTELCVRQTMQLTTAFNRLNKAKWSLSAVNRRQAEMDAERQLSGRRLYSEDNLQ